MELNEVKILSKWKVSIDTNDVVLEVISNDNEYEYYMNGIKKEFEEFQEQEIIEHIKKYIDQDELEYVIASHDYKNIYSKVDFDDLIYYFNNDFKLMEEELTNSLNIFIDQEQYEKCKVINELLNKIK